MERRFFLSAAMAVLIASAAAACATGPTIEEAETAYQELRFLNDQIEVARARNSPSSRQGTTLSELQSRLDQSLDATRRTLKAISPDALNGEDLRALREMEKTVDALALAKPQNGGEPEFREPPCVFEVDEVLSRNAPFESLKQRLYRCFGAAAEGLRVGTETTDRLTILTRLTVTENAARRKDLFHALSPIWRAVNRGNEKDSPYRALIRLSAEDLRRRGSSVESEAAATLGIDPRSVEPWLLAMLQAWSDANPGPPLEPWDYWRQAGGAAEILDHRIPLESLRAVNDRFYRDLGAVPEELGIVYDLAPRPGKTPVAFTTFGRRNRQEADRWIQGEFWVFATYRTGGLGNLAELLHETGHGLHIAAIRTRPAFQDWPDNITFTEGLADLAAWEIYEPDWQRRYLGAAAPPADSLRAKYAWVILDAAWSLFELRMHREPDRDPNQLWTEITGQYLGIIPHPELSWWALRGQLVEFPGYMLNYAIGAVLVAQTRARVRQLLSAEASPDWYALVSDGLFRHGLQRPSAQVLRDFLGREISPHALLTDMRRMERPAD